MLFKEKEKNNFVETPHCLCCARQWQQRAAEPCGGAGAWSILQGMLVSVLLRSADVPEMEKECLAVCWTSCRSGHLVGMGGTGSVLVAVHSLQKAGRNTKQSKVCRHGCGFRFLAWSKKWAKKIRWRALIFTSELVLVINLTGCFLWQLAFLPRMLMLCCFCWSISKEG